MNLLNYPKEYFGIMFKADKVKKFNFNNNLMEFIGVIVFFAILDSIILYANNVFDFQSALISLLATFIIFTFIAGMLRLTFHFYKGKASFKDDAAIVYKFSAVFLFWTSIVGVAGALLGENIFVEAVVVGLYIYLLAVSFLNILEYIGNKEKIKSPKLHQAYAISFVAIFIILALVGIVYAVLSPEEMQQIMMQ